MLCARHCLIIFTSVDTFNPHLKLWGKYFLLVHTQGNEIHDGVSVEYQWICLVLSSNASSGNSSVDKKKYEVTGFLISLSMNFIMLKYLSH